MPEMHYVTYRRADFFGSKGVPIMVGRILDSGDGEPHDHDFMEIQVVLGGSARHVTTESDVAVRRGDVFVLRPGAWHANRACRRL